MWKYEQSTGHMYTPEGELLVIGYAGHWDGTQPVGGPNDHRNRTADEHLVKLGPLPRGMYKIGQAYHHPHLGPVTMDLEPFPENQMFGRSLFRIHPDAPSHMGQASEGCIVLAHDPRQVIADSHDRILTVV